MKGSGLLLVASLIAASTMAFTSSSSSSPPKVVALNQGYGSSGKSGRSSNFTPPSDEEKFVPRFDGLRFIETLVTAHR